MSVPYTSYESQVLQCAINGLEASPTWLGILPSGYAAADCILESVGGLNPLINTQTSATAVSGRTFSVPLPPTPPTVPFCLIHQTEFPHPMVANGSWGGSGEIYFRIYLPQVAGDAPYEILRRVRNVVGGIVADIQPLRGQVTPFPFFFNFDIGMKGHSILDPTSDLFGYCTADLALTWRAP